MSDPRLAKDVERLIQDIPVLSVLDGYWVRAGKLRARLVAARRRAPLADALIAQSCLDHDVPLVSRDVDFGPLARLTRLRLLV